MSVATTPWNSRSGENLSIETDLSRAALTGADLSEADLSEANLPGTKLVRADLSRADLPGTNLSEANLSRASLTQEELEPATGDENTRLPPDLNPPAHWAVKTDEQVRED